MTKLTKYQSEALNYDKHISLNANAGSGKTFVLSKRYVDIACSDNVNLSNVVAITFTEKAAGELYRKINDEINDRIISATDSKLKWKLELIRRQLVSANISTIHSFCTSLLREFPVEAGIDANFNAIEPDESEELIDLSIEEYLNEKIYSPDSQDLKELVHLFGSKKIFERELKKLVFKRKNVQKISNSIYSKEVDEVAAFFRDSFEAITKKVFGENIDIIEDIKLINQTVLAKNPENDLGIDIGYELNLINEELDYIEKLKILTNISALILTGTYTVKKAGYLSAKDRDGLDDQIFKIEEFFNKLRIFNLTDNYEYQEKELAKVGKQIISISSEVVKIYESTKFKKGFLDFEDLLLLALKIINKDNVKKYLSEKFKYIMIDEFQDTDEIQYNIVMPILDNLKKNNLFIVGDEKQSIYMFRDAELKVFNKTKEEIRSSGGEESILQLPHSFRVSPQIALFTNKLFSKLFENPDELYNEVKPSDLICAKDVNETGGIEFIVTDKEGEQDEADLVSKKIFEIINTDLELNFDDITILCKKRKDFIVLEEKLSKYKIPYSIVDGKGFYQRQIVYDIYNILSFLLDKNNDTALVGVLRSPMFLISDTDLYLINKEIGKTFFDKLRLYGKKKAEIDKIVTTLSSYLNLAKIISISDLLRKILLETNYWTIIASKPNGEQELANLKKIISLSINFFNHGFKTLYDFIFYLEKSIESDEDEGQAQIAAGDNSVKIMTIHKSKGLEFKAVFLFNANDSLKDASIKARELFIDNDFGLLTKLPHQKNYFADYETAPILGAVNYIQKRKNIAESKRLLYVAVTRAINYLYISATQAKGKNKENSFFDMICSTLQIDLKQDIFNLKSNLKFLEVKENESVDIEKEYSIEIPISWEVESDNIELEKADNVFAKKELFINEIKDEIKHEFISATKLAIFNQCPVKYELNYEYGYSRLFNMFNNSNKNFEFENIKQEEQKADNIPANVKGLIIHRVLELYSDFADVEKNIEDIIQREVNNFEFDNKNASLLKVNILEDLEKYYSSNIFKKINEYSRYKNEYEIYTKEDNFFLYGIIDKIVYTDEKLIIVDYKTDEVNKENIKEKAENYLSQLKFYAYTLSKIFPKIKNYELWLSFVKLPDNIVKWELDFDEVKTFKSVIKKYIDTTINHEYKPNLNHCYSCNFFVDNCCVKSKFA